MVKLFNRSPPSLVARLVNADNLCQEEIEEYANCPLASLNFVRASSLASQLLSALLALQEPVA